MEPFETIDFTAEPTIKIILNSGGSMWFPLDTLRELTFLLGDADVTRTLELTFQAPNGDTANVVLQPHEIEPLTAWFRSYLLRMSEGYGE